MAAGPDAISSAGTARALVDELIRCGVRDVVLAPGSRSAPLAFAVHAADRAGRLRLHVRVDERSAAFLALGLAKVSGTPAVVCTTSGTAVANLHPAVLEAHHAGVPLIALTADRPAVLRDSGANQTTDQVRIFGVASRFFADVAPGAAAVRGVVDRAVAAARGTFSTDPGPVQLNVQFVEPLVPGTGDGDDDDAQRDDVVGIVEGRPELAPWTSAEARAGAERGALLLPIGPRTVVVAGDDAGSAARLLAERAGWPLLAEPSSGARTGEAALRSYRLLLADEALAGEIERVVVFGHPTLSRPVSRLLARADVELVVLTRTPRWVDPALAARVVTGRVEADGSHEPAWSVRWREADRAMSAAVDEVLAGEPVLTPHDAAGLVWAALPPGGLLTIGSSNPIRDLDLVAVPYPVGERRKVLANRGLAGIDGTVSTAAGAALGRPASTRALALMGDLTFLHDSGGLLAGPDEPRPDLTLVVVNDDGGGIFTTLEQGADQHADAFERVFGTPHRADLAALCAATRTPHRRVDSAAGLRAALAVAPTGIEVIEVPIDRSRRRDLDQRLRALTGQLRH